MDLATRLKIAARNVLRNRRRSVVTLSAVVIGFVALSLFEGYFMSVYSGLEDQAIIGERLGHFTITKAGYYEKAAQEPQHYAFSETELNALAARLHSLPEVKLVSPRITLSGLVSNGDSSRIYIGEGIRPADMQVLRGAKYADLPGQLDPRQPDTVVLGERLARNLGVKAGADLTLMGSTLDGLVNAVGVKVLAASATGSIGTDDKFVLTSLATAQRLNATQGAERLVVLLHDGARLPELLPQLRAEFAKDNLELRDWRELSTYYGQVRGLFDAMYLFISLVVAIVVLASVFNTMGMSIAERTREIGSLRALGMQVGTLDALFVFEGMLIVFAGCAIGTALSVGLGFAINHAGITYTPPDAASAVPLTVTLIGSNLFGTAFTLVLLAAIASWLPARRASRRSIVGALTHV